MLSKKALATASSAAQGQVIEDVFSTYLYTGNHVFWDQQSPTSQTIENGVNLAIQDGLVWVKDRSTATNHHLFDTLRGVNTEINSNTTDANTALSSSLTSFNSNGFTVGTSTAVNTSSTPYVSWTFRKASRFFDVVAYTGTGANRTINHSLGTTVGCIIIKRTDTTSAWAVYHRGNTAAPETDYLVLNTNTATVDDITYWNDTLPTDSVFTVGTNAAVNAAGGTYVAYLFAHDPLGPSGDGSDGLIACGSYTGDNTGPRTIDLGWEPQWVLVKSSSSRGWVMGDIMRGLGPATSSSLENYNRLYANETDVENDINWLGSNANGFVVGVQNNGETNSGGENYNYIAIRRGPMRKPRTGSEVFVPVVYTGSNTDNRRVNTNLLTDSVWVRQRNDTTVAGLVVGDRLRYNAYLRTGSTAAQADDDDSLMTAISGYGHSFSVMNGFGVGNDTTSKVNADTTANNHIAYAFKRAPGFFDIVRDTGTGVAKTVKHNLGAIPELMLRKKTGAIDNWTVYANDPTDYLILNTTAATADLDTMWNDTAPTSSVFTVGTNDDVNQSTGLFITYLFATLPNVSKVGTYTGNGSSQTIECGFTTGARFVLIKRIDNTGDWYVWDSARGIIAGNDPRLSLNSTAAEVTTDDTIDPASVGFIVNQVAATNVNVNAATYVFLAIS